MKSLLKTIRNLLTDNVLLKVASLIFAAIIWIAVVNVNDPTKTVTIYNVPISILDSKIITDNNQVYSINNKLTVNVTVTGRRSIISNMTEDNFSATASFTQMSSTNAIPVVVKLRNGLEKRVSIDNQSQTSLSVDIEELQTKSYDIETNILGDVAQNYVMGTVILGKNKVDIIAPESVHERIAHVRVDVDVSGAQDDIDQKLAIKVFDDKGERIKASEQVSLTLSQNKVKAFAVVNKLKRVPIKYELSGNPGSGYDVVNHFTDPEEVTICGKTNVIDSINELTITGDVLDVTGMRENREININLEDYLPEGIVLINDPNIKLTIEVEGDIYKNYTINSSDISIVNIPANYTANIVTSQIQVTLYGKEEFINKVSRAELNPVIDVKGLLEGEHNVEVELTIPDNTTISGSVSVRVKMKINKTDNTQESDNSAKEEE